MEIVWVVLLGFAGIVAVAIAASVAVTYFLRTRSREPLNIDLALMLRVYLYVAIIVGLLVFTQGASSLLRAGMASAWGEDFSYHPVYVTLPQDRLPYTPHPLELKDPNLLTADEREELRRLIEERETNRLLADEERRILGLERALDEGLIEGLSFVPIGMLVFLVHIAGQRMIGTGSGESSLHRLYLMSATVVFGLIAIISLPQAVFETLRYVLLDPIDDFGGDNQPGGELSLAIATLPIWFAYLWRTIRVVRR